MESGNKSQGVMGVKAQERNETQRNELKERNGFGEGGRNATIPPV